ncbi:MAG TPA: hypothetical protein VF638_01015 [Sphingomonas sp.]|jgi:hypothetical protein
MAFDTRADLVAAVAGWLNRTDLAARIPEFIRLTEARMNRLLRDPSQIVTTTVSFTAGSGALPVDFGEMISLGQQGSRLTQVTPGEFGTYRAQAGDARVYSVIGGNIVILPAGASASLNIAYYRSISPLIVDGSTNWLLSRAPDIYLWGCLLQAELYGWNDERLPLLKTGWDEAIAELRIDGEQRRWGAAPLAPKIRRR